MRKWKKYIILGVIIIILLFISFVVFKKKEHKNNLIEATSERVSNDYKIMDDFVSVNAPAVEESEQNPNPSETDGQSNIMNDVKELTLVSSAFAHQGDIPSRYSCDGENISPPFEIFGVSEEAKSLVLIMDDPDAPTGVWDHWVKFNIPAKTETMREGEEPRGISGKGTGGNLEYSGPCPPDKKHRYFFKLYALDTELILPEGSVKAKIEKAMEGHILQETELMGNYERVEKVSE